MGGESSKGYRVRRPKAYDDLLNSLRDKDIGVFSTLKSALVFSAAIGYKNDKRLEFTDSGEPIALTLFNESFDQPFIYSLALAKFQDVSYLQEEKFGEVIRLFEEFAAGGLQYLDEVLDKANIKESIESLIAETDTPTLLENISDEWN